MHYPTLCTSLFALATLAATSPAEACTNFIVTRGASADGSVMITYAADSHQLYGALYHYAPTRLAYVPIYEWDTGRYLGLVEQAPVTYATIGNMNEWGLTIGETTYGGLEHLVDTTGGLDYGSLIYLTLQRARTAREAIGTIVELARRYGYCSEGESFSIGDPDEAWIMDLIGKGTTPDGEGGNRDRGIAWVARRVPDGYVSGHANQSRIDRFPLDNPRECLYDPDLIPFARRAGLYAGPDSLFSFCDTFSPNTFETLRGCESRVWSFFNRVADGMEVYADYATGLNPANRMPLWVKPRTKVSARELFDCMRDHYEDTPMDMRCDIGAGGFGLPYRWRPMTFEVDGVEYTNERATATQQTGFWFVAQCRNFVPEGMRGLLWFGVDDAATSALTPIYCCTDRVPECLAEENGSMLEYSPTSSFWLFNRVAQFCYLRYRIVEPDVRRVIDRWETERLQETRTLDEQAARLFARSPRRARRMLADYSVRTAQALFDRWAELDRYLMVKYIDGNVKLEDEKGFRDNGYDPRIPAMPSWPGYDERWQRAVVRDAGERLRIIPTTKP